MKPFCIFIPSSVLLVVAVSISICSASSIQGKTQDVSESKEIFDSSKGWYTLETVRALQNRTGDRGTVCHPDSSALDCGEIAKCIAYNPTTKEASMDFSEFPTLPFDPRRITFSLTNALCSLKPDFVEFFICLGINVDCMCTHGALGMACGSREGSSSAKYFACIYKQEEADQCGVKPCKPWETCKKYLKGLPGVEEHEADLAHLANCASSILCELLTQFILVPECNSPFPLSLFGKFICQGEMTDLHGADSGMCLPYTTVPLTNPPVPCIYESIGVCSLYKHCPDIRFCFGCYSTARPTLYCDKNP